MADTQSVSLSIEQVNQAANEALAASAAYQQILADEQKKQSRRNLSLGCVVLILFLVLCVMLPCAFSNLDALAQLVGQP